MSGESFKVYLENSMFVMTMKYGFFSFVEHLDYFGGAGGGKCKSFKIFRCLRRWQSG